MYDICLDDTELQDTHTIVGVTEAVTIMRDRKM